MPSKTRTIFKNSPSYLKLRKQVEETLLLGQRKVEEAKVQTYWKTGKLIDEHILSANRLENYGKELIENLSSDLKLSTSVLWRCVRFFRSFKKIVAGRQESFSNQLSWSHYRELIIVKDEQMRLSFMQRAQKGGWSSEELGEKIRLETGKLLSQGSGDVKSLSRLIPKKGMLYTYQLIAPDSVHEKEDKRPWIDLGFQTHRKIPFGSKGFKEGDIVESLKKDTRYSIVHSKCSKDELYTYKAFVERVVDADTLIVKIDLGFEIRIRQYLRLRGIDTPELFTPEGKKARAFVERELAKAPYIILTSSRSDKYDRYLADIFYMREETEPQAVLDKGIFLNQELLDRHLAKIW
jgi:hypothetical protein